MSGWRREGCRITASPDLNTLFPASANLAMFEVLGHASHSGAASLLPPGNQKLAKNPISQIIAFAPLSSPSPALWGWRRFFRRHILPGFRLPGVYVADADVYTPPLVRVAGIRMNIGGNRCGMRGSRVKCGVERGLMNEPGGFSIW